jgi:hypothetical protein
MPLETKCLNQFIPEKFMYLTDSKKIEFNGINLKTDYLINIINELVIKYYFHKEDLIDREIKFNMWSEILRKKYGTKYNYYINYLIENKFMYLVSNYYRNKKSRTYSLNVNGLVFIKKTRVCDNILIKKLSSEFSRKMYIEYNNSPINIEVRKKVVDDLFKIKLNKESAMVYLDGLKENKEITHIKYMKNYMSVDNISNGNLFFKFDEFGRFHTNFTVLKKYIRKNFITINGEPIEEIDINNSQPLFLAAFMKKEMPISKFLQKDVSRYIELVKNGLIYEELEQKCNLSSREDSKIMMYKILFGYNNIISLENKLFYDVFPTVHDFVKEYKTLNNNYKTISHELQLMESNFIFNTIIKHIMNSHPEITLFTVHDSICFQERYKPIVNEIFKYYRDKIIIL